jgi:hypothetical protein
MDIGIAMEFFFLCRDALYIPVCNWYIPRLETRKSEDIFRTSFHVSIHSFLVGHLLAICIFLLGLVDAFCSGALYPARLVLLHAQRQLGVDLFL